LRVEPCIVAGVPPQAKLPVTFPNIENEEGNRKKTWPRPHCDGTKLSPATSASGPGSPLPHLHRDRAHPCRICTGTGLTPATSAPRPGSPLPHLHRDRAQPLPHLHRDWARPLPHWTALSPRRVPHSTASRDGAGAVPGGSGRRLRAAVQLLGGSDRRLPLVRGCAHAHSHRRLHARACPGR
jgi:hypothetical protein